MRRHSAKLIFSKAHGGNRPGAIHQDVDMIEALGDLIGNAGAFALVRDVAGNGDEPRVVEVALA